MADHRARLSDPTHNFHSDTLFHRRFSQLQHAFGHLSRKIILPAIITYVGRNVFNHHGRFTSLQSNDSITSFDPDLL